MLGDLEDLIEVRLNELSKSLPRLRVASYGGELSDPDLLPELLKRCPSILLMVPKAMIRPKAQGRYSISITFRLVIAARHPRGGEGNAARHN
ncbi:hypothetical protein [Pseudomonas shahriarae]|jgi:hypothetical protein|uniref:hypothetical protein n=1 Tax=Pseudomonas shahriarae TaxID=2745512 RepID=UPI003A0FEB8F